MSRTSNRLINSTKDGDSNDKIIENACINFVVVYFKLMEFKTDTFHQMYLLGNFDSF